MKIFGIDVKDWATLIGAVAGALVTLIPTVIALIGTVKSRAKAKTAAAKAAAEADMKAQAETLIAAAEVAYKKVDGILKAQGSSAGAAKKESVLTKLQAYAIDKKYEFDAAAWGEKIDAIVALTKQVNVK